VNLISLILSPHLISVVDLAGGILISASVFDLRALTATISPWRKITEDPSASSAKEVSNFRVQQLQANVSVLLSMSASAQRGR
jgi:hypothetical protein